MRRMQSDASVMLFLAGAIVFVCLVGVLEIVL